MHGRKKEDAKEETEQERTAKLKKIAKYKRLCQQVLAMVCFLVRMSRTELGEEVSLSCSFVFFFFH
jgi:hypothetical protein